MGAENDNFNSRNCLLPLLTLLCIYWFWGNTTVKEMTETIWVQGPLIIIIIPIFKHFINEILTGHLVFELVKLPPPNGDEERPEKVSLL